MNAAGRDGVEGLARAEREEGELVGLCYGKRTKTGFYYFVSKLKALMMALRRNHNIKRGVWIMCRSYNESANELTSVEIWESSSRV